MYTPIRLLNIHLKWGGLCDFCHGNHGRALILPPSIVQFLEKVIRSTSTDITGVLHFTGEYRMPQCCGGEEDKV